MRALLRAGVRLGRWGIRLGLAAGAFLLVNQLLRREPEPSTGDAGHGARSGPRPEPRPATPTRAGATPSSSVEDPPATPSGDPATGGAPTVAPETPAPAAEAAGTPVVEAAWVDPEGGACPATHPVKVKLSSGIFHEPGMLAYDRTTPDRCYRDAVGAEADGFRRAKR
jgi:hypothetical protein